MSKPMSSALRREYMARINKVSDYIGDHIGEKLDLETLAGVAGFSPYHFHRMYAAATCETLGAAVLRLRLEKAAGLIADREEEPITGIALDCGFSGSAVFSRAFRKHFGVSPTEWREGAWKEYSKISKRQSSRYQRPRNYREAMDISVGYDEIIKRHWRIVMKTEKQNLECTVTVKEMPQKHLAYVRHVGPYAGDAKLFKDLFGRLMTWAGARNLFVPGQSEMMTIYHDSPEVTDEEKLRISVCLTVPEGTEVSGEVGEMDLPAGEYAVAEFRITPDQYGDAWNAVFGGWLPESGYQCADGGACYELYLGEPDPETGEHHIAICVPVKPL